MGDQEMNIKLVGEVEKHEALYNYKLPDYSRKDVTEKAWKEVAAEVNMPVQDCKEKWRNLRTVLMRRMKPSPSGSGGKKKAYYLENAMQFCLPFIKTVTPPSPGNLPPQPSNTQSTVPEIEGSETQIDDPIQLEIDPTDEGHFSPEMSPSILKHSQQAVEMQSTSSTSSNRPTQIPKRKAKSAATMADQTVAEYFREKRAKLLSKPEADDTNQKIDRQQGIKMFLLSLIPELEELSDLQIKRFKRQVLRVIDDISFSGHHQQQPRSSSGLTILTSPTMSDSRDSQIDLTHMSSDVNIQTADFYNAFSQGLNSSNM